MQHKLWRKHLGKTRKNVPLSATTWIHQNTRPGSFNLFLLQHRPPLCREASLKDANFRLTFCSAPSSLVNVHLVLFLKDSLMKCSLYPSDNRLCLSSNQSLGMGCECSWLVERPRVSRFCWKWSCSFDRRSLRFGNIIFCRKLKIYVNLITMEAA